ncbi:L-histidine N(alpha)-methyltransferase [Dactylosporangium matsuzakiense]|uniref:Histidine N-alpha-methyltransferase n=1 Tax=Dactylosporangium matsuzakiense TaxID=53360 RepID=A0A9W6NNE0_9ACTN|nr:histidine N-alpha-methyltransferase [Dactylosporangium matsuzakiense]
MTLPDLELDIHLTDADLAAALRSDARTGLTATPKHLPPKYFYDARGSELFEEITRLHEYYPTRAEREILAERAGAIARRTGAKTLIELGSGSSEKTRLLLDALREHGTLASFTPLDVSAAALRGALSDLRREYPDLHLQGIVADFVHSLDVLPEAGTRLVAFLGGTIGNFTPAERAPFLAALRARLSPGEFLLLGADLVKSPAVLIPAYDDESGVTAEFNRNVLHVLNRELGAHFDPALFAHVARWDAANEWIEMRLRALVPMTVRIDALDLTVSFAEGEELRTEVSAKFRREGLTAELAAAGFAVRDWWTDAAGRFALTLATAV